MKIDTLFFILAAFFVLVIALVIYAFIDNRTSITEFKEVCAQNGGVTVNNGRNYECIIKACKKD